MDDYNCCKQDLYKDWLSLDGNRCFRINLPMEW